MATLNERRMTLQDGRTLAFTDQGNPNGYPLIFGHGMPGYRLGQRMDLGVCLSGYTHFAEYQGTHHLIEGTRWPGPRLARYSPALVRLAVQLVTWLSQRHPNLYLQEATQLVHEGDRQLLQELHKQGEFRKDQVACLNSGGRAIAADLLTELRHWQFQLADVQVPVWIYQGEEDAFIPVDYAQHLADNLPSSTLTLMPGTGHLYPLSCDFQNELFRRLRRHLA